MNQHGDSENLQDFDFNLEGASAEFNNVQLTNRPFILSNHRRMQDNGMYNFPTQNLEENYFLIIFDNENNTFKVNVALGMILRNSETGKYRYYIPYSNSFILTSPTL